MVESILDISSSVKRADLSARGLGSLLTIIGLLLQYPTSPWLSWLHMVKELQYKLWVKIKRRRFLNLLWDLQNLKAKRGPDYSLKTGNNLCDKLLGQKLSWPTLQNGNIQRGWTFNWACCQFTRFTWSRQSDETQWTGPQEEVEQLHGNCCGEWHYCNFSLL